MMSNNTQRTARVLLVTLTLLSGMWLLTPSFVFAQSSTSPSSSHRRLELPEGGSPDVLRQMQMLKQLQSLFGGTQNGGESKTPPISPGQMEMMRQMMKNFGGQVPEDLMKQLGNLPPGLVEGVANDPKAHQQIKDMLEQYSRDGKIPRGRPQSGNSPLPPGNGNSRSKFDANSTPQKPDWDPSRRKQEKSTEPPAETPNSTGDLLKKLKDFEKKHLSQQGDSDGNRQPEPAPNDGVQRNVSPNLSGSTPGSDKSQESDDGRGWSNEEINKRIDEMLQQQRGEDSPKRDNRSINNSDSGVPLSNKGGQPEGPTADARAKEPGFTSVADFMKKFDDLFPPGNNNGKSPADATANSASVDEDAQRKAAEELRKNQERVKSELGQKGFRETLMRIARDAKRQAKEARPAATPSAEGEGATPAGKGGLTGAMADAMTGIVKDLGKIVKDGKWKAPKPKKGGNRPSGGGIQKPPTSTLGEMANSASDFLSDVVQAPSEAAAATSNADSGEGSTFSTTGLLPLAVLVALVCIGIAAAKKYGVIGPDPSEHHARSLAAAKAIQTRADIVQAFHQMALKPGHNSELWWTHQKVVDELVEEKPGKALSATTLSSLYEQARYLPDEVEFTAAQIENAKQALTQCQR